MSGAHHPERATYLYIYFHNHFLYENRENYVHMKQVKIKKLQWDTLQCTVFEKKFNSVCHTFVKCSIVGFRDLIIFQN